jgi:hypothetical protein
MSESDILSIQLWFGAAAIAVGAIGMTAAGWNQKSFIWSMFALAALLAGVAIFWPEIRLQIPDKMDDRLTIIANSRIAWFIMFGISVVAIALVARLKNSRSVQQPAAIQEALPASNNFPITDWDKPLEKRFRKAYKNETVLLDGLEFIECTFENVTFKYQGTKPYRLHTSSGNSKKLTTDNVVVGQTVILVNQINGTKLEDYEIYPTGSR